MISEEEIERIKYYNSIEIPHISTWYGGDRIIAAVAGRFASLFRLAYWDHGIPFYDPRKREDFDLSVSNSEKPIYLATNWEGVRLARKFTRKKTLLFGNYFIYYRRSQSLVPDKNARGTLAFPAHSTHWIEAVFDWEEYGKRLLLLPEEMQPVTVAVYWKDVLLGRHKVLEELDLETITNGHMFDPVYPDNFYRNILSRRFTTSNLPGSYLLYSLDLGIPFFFLGDHVHHDNRSNDPGVLPGVYEKNSLPEYRRLYHLFTYDGSIPEITPSQKKYFREKIGNSLSHFYFAIVYLSLYRAIVFTFATVQRSIGTKIRILLKKTHMKT